MSEPLEQAEITLIEPERAQPRPPSCGIVPVTVVFLTFNEEANLPGCLEAVAGWGHEIFIVDSGSTDATLEIARHYGAQCFYHAFEGHTRQWNWALRNLPFSCEWAFCLDADQRLTPEVKREVAALLQGTAGGPPKGVDGYYLNRRQIFRGQWIKHGGYYPKPLLKLVRHRSAWCDENELLDSRFYVEGATARLQHDLIEDNRKEDDISFWTAKHIRYAELQAREELLRRDGLAQWNLRPAFFGSPDQRSLWLRQLWYRHMPLYVRPWLYYFYRYFLRLGILDGKQGFIFHFLQALWFRLLVDVKIDELRRAQAAERGRASAQKGSG
jgi:glycosyltransferase involved in cell wall biosynthesis